MTASVQRVMWRHIAVVYVLTSFCACAVSRGLPQLPSSLRLPPGDLLEADEESTRRADLRAVYPKGIQLTKRAEGWVPRLYNDAANFCTIGYGHLVKRQPCNGTEPIEFLTGISEPRGEEILVEDMARAQQTVVTSVMVSMSDGQYAALVDFVFNVGSTNFRRSTLLAYVNAEQLDRVPGQFRRWILAGGKPWPGLKERREREIELFFEGLPATRAVEPALEVLTPIDIREGEP